MEKNIKVNIQADTTGVKSLRAELREVMNELQRAELGTAEFDRLNQKAAELQKSLKGVEKAAESIDLKAKFDDVYEGIAPLSSRLGELEDRMYELAFAGKAGTKEFEALRTEAATMRQTIISVDKSVDLLAENKGFSVFGAGIGSVSDSLMNLDFATAAKEANNLAKASKMITFKDSISSLKQLGSAFLSIGKAILTNPLFLIVGVVTAIIAGIVALMDKLGILKKIFDFVGGAIDAVVEAIKKFLDYIGLTDFAAEESAKKQAAAQEKIAQSYVDKQERVTDAYDQEIRLAKIAGKDTVELEKQKQYAIIETSQQQYKALNAQMEALRASGTLTKEKADEIRKAMLDLKKNIREARQEVQAINAQDVADTSAAAEAKLQKQREAAIKAKQIRDEAEKQRKADEEKAFEEQKKRMLEEAKELDELVASIEGNRIKAEKERQDKLSAMFEESNKNAAARREQDSKNYDDKVKNDLEIEKNYIDARKNLNATLIQGLSGLASFLEQQGVKTAGLQKVIALVQIATDTAKAISSVIAGATAAAAASGPGAPFVLAGYIASGIGIVLGAIGQAQKALKSAPSLGGSVGGGTPISAPSGGASPSTPNVSLFGNNNNTNNLSSSKSVEVIQVQAVVSETDMTNTQNKIKNIQQAAGL
jgi:hypothetical protein